MLGGRQETLGRSYGLYNSGMELTPDEAAAAGLVGALAGAVAEPYVEGSRFCLADDLGDLASDIKEGKRDVFIDRVVQILADFRADQTA